MRLFWFLSKNKNNNGFGAIGLSFYSLLAEGLWRIFILLSYFCIVLSC